MNSKQEDHDQREDRSGRAEERGPFGAEEFVAPGAPIMRNSTPRPLSWASNSSQTQGIQRPEHETMSVFPPQAPTAPPLPEELGESEQEGENALQTVEATPFAGRSETAEEVPAEFVWLFEYSLEMDISLLNSAERLNGLALPYGPAVLKGYEITADGMSSHAGAVVASIVPSRKREAEVWGVLYRIPRRLAGRSTHEPALLDKIHCATPPDGLFERLSVEVYETYRGREITCITYIASAAARNQFHLLPRNRQGIDASYVQRLLEIARKQELPDDYLSELSLLTSSEKEMQPAAAATALEQNIEPSPPLVDERRTLPSTDAVQRTSPKSYGLGMVIFALYMVFALLAVFIFAILEGLGVGADVFPASFAPPGIPWFIAVYGFLGGCLSCIINLGRHHTAQPPTFVLITWFARPLIGVVLAMAAYLLLNSGFFVLGGNVEQHYAIYSLLALLASSCEGWFFYKRAGKKSLL